MVAPALLAASTMEFSIMETSSKISGLHPLNSTKICRPRAFISCPHGVLTLRQNRASAPNQVFETVYLFIREIQQFLRGRAVVKGEYAQLHGLIQTLRQLHH